MRNYVEWEEDGDAENQEDKEQYSENHRNSEYILNINGELIPFVGTRQNATVFLSDDETGRTETLSNKVAGIELDCGDHVESVENIVVVNDSRNNALRVCKECFENYRCAVCGDYVQQQERFELEEEYYHRDCAVGVVKRLIKIEKRKKRRVFFLNDVDESKKPDRERLAQLKVKYKTLKKDIKRAKRRGALRGGEANALSR